MDEVEQALAQEERVLNAEQRGLLRYTIGGRTFGKLHEGDLAPAQEYQVGYLEAFAELAEARAQAQQMLSEQGNGWIEIRRSAPSRFKYGEPQWLHRGEVIEILEAPRGPRHP